MQGSAQTAVPVESTPEVCLETRIRAGTDTVVNDSLLTLAGWTTFIVAVNTLGDAVFGVAPATLWAESFFVAAILAVYLSLRRWSLPARWANAVVALIGLLAAVDGLFPPLFVKDQIQGWNIAI